MASLMYEKQIASIYYTLLRKSPTERDLKALSDNLEKKGPAVLENIISELMKTPEAKLLYGNHQNNFEIMRAFFKIVHGREMGQAEFKLWYNDSTLDLNHNLFRIVNELVTNTAPWPKLNDDMSNTDYEFNYPEQRLIDKEHFLDNGNLTLYPGTSNIVPSGDGATDILGIFHVLGAGITRDVSEFWVPLINKGDKTLIQATEVFIKDRPYLNNVTNKTFVKKIFENTFERPATNTELNIYLELLATGSSRAEISINIMKSLRESTNESDATAKSHLAAASHAYERGELPPLEYQEKIAALYLIGAERNINSEALFGWSQKLASGIPHDKIVSILTNTSEFNRISTHLDINSYAKRIYLTAYGHNADNSTLEKLISLGDKNKIISAVISSLIDSNTKSKSEYYEQFQFALRIAGSLNYKKDATLTNETGNSPESTINSGITHILSQAEKAQLERVILNLTTDNTVDLTMAANLRELVINGKQEAEITLANYKNYNSTIININGHIQGLKTGNADTLVMLNDSHDTLDTYFYFGSGNDFLGWRADEYGENKISPSLYADGGLGINSISANFISLFKDVFIRKGTHGIPDIETTTYISNIIRFSNFDLIDLYKYTGKVSTKTYIIQADGTIVRSSTVSDFTFDYDFVSNKYGPGGNPNDVGRKGFSIINVTNEQQSTTSDVISVINVTQGASKIYVGNHSNNPVTGDGGNYLFKFKNDVSVLEFFTNQKNGEDILKPLGSSPPEKFVNAGEFALIGETLKTVKINTSGESNNNNLIALDFTSSNVDKVIVSGVHKLGLVATHGSFGAREFTYDATESAGIDITITPELYTSMSKKITVLGSNQGNEFHLFRETKYYPQDKIIFIGGAGDDYFDINNIVTAMGGDGTDFFNIMSSSNKTSTLYDFNSHKDIIGLKSSGIYISGRESGEKIPFTDTVSGGNKVQDYGYIENLFNPNTPLNFHGKVGAVSTMDVTMTKETYIVVDLNDNKIFDTNDALIKISGQPDTAELASQLYY